jgi:type II secretory pathway pseudopilin PulG
MAPYPRWIKFGQSLIEILVAIGISAIILPALYTGLLSSRQGKYQTIQYTLANILLSEGIEAAKTVRETGWTIFAVNGTFYPEVSGSNWVLLPGTQLSGDFTRSIVISDAFRDASGNIVTSGGVNDPSTKKVVTTVSWTVPVSASVVNTAYFTRYLDNLVFLQTTEADFNLGTKVNTTVINTSGGEFRISDNTKAKWCSPAFSPSTIDLPDGPPVAVAARSNSSTSVPNDVLVATSPFTTSSAKMAYILVSANVDPPTSSLNGIFSLDPAKYSAPELVPTGIGLDNNFKTTDIRYYTSSSGNLYALLATNKPDREVIAISIDDSDMQDPTNRIYKYWTYFNTRMFNPTVGLATGLKNPTANAADSGGDGNGFATYPTRAYSDNSSYAIDSNSGNGTGTSCTGADKDKHRFYNYDFNLPSGSTINGIEVRLDARVDSQAGSPQMCVQLSWNGGASWTTPQSTSILNTSEGTYLLGGAADTWGRTWSDTDLTNANFRLRVINVASQTTRDFSLDWAAVNVFYSSSGTSTNDQAPFDYGGTTLTVLGDSGYVASGGYMYVFDLSNIDSKSPSSELDQVGCRIQLDGYDCQPGDPALDRKYSAGQTGTTWSDIGYPAHNDCSDGGNIELFATNDLYGVQVDGHNYIYVAVGAGTNPEFEIVDATSIPTTSTSPTINNSSCGRISGGNAGWKMVGSYDFNTVSGTEEAANSVYAKSDGTRAYISSNGTTDSKQFYILNTTTKTSPAFLSGSPATGPTSGFYQGTGANGEMYPRRSLTVLGGQRVVLVGKDGVPNTNDAWEYQVLNSESEASPGYCGGINFDQGFNDLTSVSEADGDNFVYMVANTEVNELKIIQGGADGTYVESGTYESPVFDPGYQSGFNRFFATSTTPANTSVQYQVSGADQVAGSCASAAYTYVGPDGTSGTFFTSTGGRIPLDDDGSDYENPASCFRIKSYLTTTDFNVTPFVSDITVNYSP